MFVPVKLLSIALLAYDRPEATIKCLCSLRDAYYPPNTLIPLRIYVDRLVDGSVNTVLLNHCTEFKWNNGPKSILVQKEHLGLQSQWLSIKVDDTTIVIEDDVLVSPFYYLVLKNFITSNRLKSHHFGVSLQRPQWQLGQNELGRWRRLDLIRGSQPPLFSFPAPSTWGFLTFPSQWDHFCKWVRRLMVSRERRSFTKGAITTKWTLERGGEDQLISPLIFEYLFHHEMDIVYFWLGNSTVLATSRPPSLVNFPSKNSYNQDTLLYDEGKFWKLSSLIRSFSEIPRYSVCFDLITIVNDDLGIGRVVKKNHHPVIEILKDEGDHDQLLVKKVIRHLINACRITNMRIVTKETGHAPTIHSSHYQFDCNLNANENTNANRSRSRNGGDSLLLGSTGNSPLALLPFQSISCNYKIGLYPDYS